MSKSRWIIAVTLGLIVAWSLDAQENEPQPKIQPQTTQQQPADQTSIEPPSAEPPIVSPANEPSNEHNGSGTTHSGEEPYQYPSIILGDGWAQWAMVVLSFFALCVSAWAVWLLRGTLKATREAVRSADDAVTATKEVGQAQVRAYVTINSVSAFIDGQNRPKVEVSIKNNGASPAKNIKVIVMCDIGPASVVPDGFDNLAADAAKVLNNGPRRFQTETRASLPFDFASSAEANRAISFAPLQDDAVLALTPPPSIFRAFVEIRYIDVFGLDRIEQQNFMAIAPQNDGWQQVRPLERFGV